jgi:hypothetical protein
MCPAQAPAPNTSQLRARFRRGHYVTAVNDAGEIAGYYLDANNACHGFVRAANGAVTTIDAPGAGSVHGFGTFATSINAARAIAGVYFTGFSFVSRLRTCC